MSPSQNVTVRRHRVRAALWNAKERLHDQPKQISLLAIAGTAVVIANRNAVPTTGPRNRETPHLVRAVRLIASEHHSESEIPKATAVTLPLAHHSDGQPDLDVQNLAK